MSTSYSTLPANLQAEAEAYVEHGKRPGTLLLAVLESNLFAALDAMPSGLSAEAHLALLNTLVVWARVEAPCISRGAVEMTTYWMEGGGKQGRAAARATAAAVFAARTAANEAAAAGKPHLQVVSGEASAQHALRTQRLADAIVQCAVLGKQQGARP